MYVYFTAFYKGLKVGPVLEIVLRWDYSDLKLYLINHFIDMFVFLAKRLLRPRN